MPHASESSENKGVRVPAWSWQLVTSVVLAVMVGGFGYLWVANHDAAAMRTDLDATKAAFGEHVTTSKAEVEARFREVKEASRESEARMDRRFEDMKEAIRDLAIEVKQLREVVVRGSTPAR